MKPDIVYEDGNIIICNKPAGIASQSDRSFDADLLGGVKTYRSERGDKGDTFIINRLDKPVGGLVCGVSEPKGAYSDWLIKESKENYSKAVPEGTPGAKKAALNYETVNSRMIDGVMYSLVKIKLHTGRHHQIRVQFASHGHAIYGDTKYNPAFAGRRGVTPALFAYMLSFNNPSGAERVSVEINPKGGVWQEFEGYF